MPSAHDPRVEILSAAAAAVAATRVCIYSVGADLQPYGHLTASGETDWVQRYARFSDADPFHPRYFAGALASVFRTHEGGGPSSLQELYLAGFRRPMGVAFKAEVFLRDRRGSILAGIRLSRTEALGEFGDGDVERLRALQPVLSAAWRDGLSEARVGSLRLQLTARESEVLSCLRQGFSNKRIGLELGLALPTTKGHVQRIMNKAGVSSRTELLARLGA